MKLKFDITDYTIVKEKSSGRYFATLKTDTPRGKWDKLLEEEVNCIPISKDGELEEMFSRPVKRNDLDNNIWIKEE
ncbi:MAG: hypothetical protein KA146_06785 [Leptospiraceae bacterium]|nr:hypothetical protein [Leptospiraceae bacterium]